MEIQMDTIGDVPVVHIVGEVGRLAGSALKKAVGNVLLGPDPPHCLLVDLSDCTYLDAVALSVLLGTRERLAPGHCLGLIGPSHNIRHLLSVVGLEESEQVHVLSSRMQAEELLRENARLRGSA